MNVNDSGSRGQTRRRLWELLTYCVKKAADIAELCTLLFKLREEDTQVPSLGTTKPFSATKSIPPSR